MPTEKLTETCVRSDAAASSAASRSTRVDLVRMLKGLRAPESVSTMPRVRWYFPSACWYGSVLVPMAMLSPPHLGERSSARNRSTALTLTTILRSKSDPIPRPR